MKSINLISNIMLVFLLHKYFVSYASISKKKKNQDDLLVVTTRVSDENVSMIIEGKR